MCMILKRLLADLQSAVSEALTKSAENVRLVMTGQISFLLLQDPRHLVVIRLGMLVLNRFVLGAAVVGHSYLLSIGDVMSIGLDYGNDQMD